MVTKPTGHGLPAGQRLGEHAYEVVKERLLEGRWRAGQTIAVESLKSYLGVSKQPVMEALRRLSAEGLVEIIPQVGCRVPTYSVEETEDFFTMFAGLEAETTAVAVKRYSMNQLTELDRINQEIGRLLDVADLDRRVHGYMKLNRDFHGMLLDMTHSAILLRVSEQMWDMSDLLINTGSGTRPLADEIGERYAEHERIIAAIRESHGGDARREMRKHILRNIAMLERAR